MYDFHYNVLKPKYSNNMGLRYQDTDYIYEDMKETTNHYDPSNYPLDPTMSRVN